MSFSDAATSSAEAAGSQVAPAVDSNNSGCVPVATADVSKTGSALSQNKQVDAALMGGSALDAVNGPGAHAPTELDSRKRLALAIASLDVPEAQKQVLEKLRQYQERHLELEEQYRQEWNQLKLKYLGKFHPLYEGRKEALTGGKTSSSSSPPSPPPGSSPKPGATVTGTRNLPGFWLKAIRNHVLLEEMIEDCDVPVLAYLEDIVFSWVDPNEQTSFKLDFYFAPNEYFTNTILSKTYHLERLQDDEEESVLTRTEGTVIDWYPNKNVTQKTIQRRQRNKRTNETRVVSQVVEKNSFFNYFRSHEVPNADQYDNFEESEMTELEMIIEAEFEVGCILRDKIIPRALGWYLGIEKDDEAESDGGSVADDEGEEDFDDEDDEGHDDDEDDGHDEDEEDDE